MNKTDYTKALTIADIAQELGVSKTTVSRAISGKGRIGQETRKKILDYIDEHNYKPNVVAQGLAQSKTFNICAVMPGKQGLTDMPFFRNSLMGLVELTGERGYDVIVTMSDDNDITNLDRVISNRKVDGVVLLRAVVEDPAVKYLKERQVPFVVLGSVPDQDVLQVDSAHREACKELTEKLLESGSRRIALLGGNERHVVNRNRLAGFLEAFEGKGMKADEELIYLNVKQHVGGVEKKAKEAMRQEVDTIICTDDTICMGVLNMFEREKINIPKEVKIASFYNSAVLDNHVPSITTLKFDARELGAVCAELLLERIEKEPEEMKRMLGYEVVMGDSTN